MALSYKELLLTDLVSFAFLAVVVTVSAASEICILLSARSCIFMQICFLHFLEPVRRAESDISSAGWLTGTGTYAKQSAMFL